MDRDSTLHPRSVLVTEMVANAVAVSRLFVFLCLCVVVFSRLHRSACGPLETDGHIHPMQNCCHYNLPKSLISPRYVDRRCFHRSVYACMLCICVCWHYDGLFGFPLSGSSLLSSATGLNYHILFFGPTSLIKPKQS